MHHAPPHPHTGELAASGLLLGGGLAVGGVLARRHRRVSRLSVGEVLQRRILGTEARYRVLGAARRTVEVEVLDAPGLVPGMRLRLSAAAARAARRGAAAGGWVRSVA